MTGYDYSIYYRRFHDESEEHARRMEHHFAALLNDVLPEERSAPILDVGCGFGFALRALKSMGYADIRGLDMSAEQARRCASAGFRVDVCDDTKAWLLAHRAAFECVVLLDVLEHVPRAEQIDFLRAIHVSLRPGGRLILTTPNASAILSPRWMYNDYTHHSSFTEHSLHFVLESAQFERVRLDSSKGIGRFPRRLWRRSAWPAVRRWIVRWCWLQVFKAELPWERIDEISFELNLKAVAYKGS